MNKRKMSSLAAVLLLGLLTVWHGAEGSVLGANASFVAEGVAAITQSLGWAAFGSGGGQAESGDGAIVLNSTLGQPVVGSASDTESDTVLSSGYWPAYVEVTLWYVYLPIVQR